MLLLFIWSVKCALLSIFLYRDGNLGICCSLGAEIGLMDGIYALLAFPTMISAFILAPKVMKAAKVYFAKDDL